MMQALVSAIEMPAREVRIMGVPEIKALSIGNSKESGLAASA
jgi:hypothetical protein